jgi:hypothetical protein
MITRMAALELVRLCSRGRLWLLVAVASVYGGSAAWLEVEGVALGSLVEPSPSLYLALSMQSLWLLVLMLPLGAGGTLALDARSGYLALLRARGATPNVILASRLIAGCGVALVSFMCAGIASIGFAGAYGIVRAARGPAGEAISFLPHLLDAAPHRWMVLVTVVYVLAGAAVVTLGIMLAALSEARYVSEIGPPLIVLILGFGMTGALWPLNPLERASFLQISGAGWTAAESMIVYWLVVLIGTGGVALFLWGRRYGRRA